MASFVDENVTVHITRMQAKSDFENFLEGQADFLSRVTIDGKRFGGREFRNRNDLNPGNAWRFTNANSVPSGRVPIKIEILEGDRGPDTRVNVNPASSSRDLNLLLDMETGQIFNQDDNSKVIGRSNESITLRGGDGPDGEITFTISGVGGPEARNAAFVQNSFVQETPESFDSLGGQSAASGNRFLAVGDFNADGRDDLVVDVPGEDPSPITHVLEGSSSGLRGMDRSSLQKFTRPRNPSGLTVSELEVGDINGDGTDDLVIGDITPIVRFGRAGSGLTTAQSITKASTFANSITFGSSVAVGDFNGDGRDDVATADPFARISGAGSAGAVQINFGTRSGINSRHSQLFHRNIPGIPGTYEPGGTQFGQAMAAGDINGDGRDDLIIGAPISRDTAPGAGTVHVLYGSRTGLTTTNNQLTGQFFAGVTDRTGDDFGRAIAVGDVNGDGVDDVVIGAPGRNNNAGVVYVYEGRRGQSLPITRPKVLTKSSLFGGTSRAGDLFGSSIEVKDINNDNFDDIVIGAPGSDKNAGTVHVSFGSSTGSTSNVRRFRQGIFGVAGNQEARDFFGDSLAVGNFNGTGEAEIAIGVPGEDIGNVSSAGMVNIVSVSQAPLSSFNLSAIRSTRVGDKSNNILRGNKASGIVDGGGGRDRVITKGGDDLGMGGVGRDFVNGGAGDDLIDGGKGADTLKGGLGNDVFVIAPKHGSDTILDFKDGIDYIGLAGGLEFDDLRLIQKGSGTVIKASGGKLAFLKGVDTAQLSVEDMVQIGQTQFEDRSVPTILG